jgi:hypothetical protein
MELKHTKGDWMMPHFVTNDNKEDRCQCGFILNEQYCGAIATVHFSENSDVENGDNPLKEEAIANAKLMVAAPKLLEAMQEIESYINKMGVVSIAMSRIKTISKEAIKKATD